MSDTAGGSAKELSKTMNAIALRLLLITVLQYLFVFIAGMAIAVYSFIAIGAEGGEAFRTGFMDDYVNRAMYSAICPLFAMGIPLLLFVFRFNISPKKLLAPPQELKSLFIPLLASGFFLSFLAKAPFLIVDRIKGTDFSVSQLIDLPPADGGGSAVFWAVVGCYFLLTVIISPILEELVFRGVILSALRPYGDAFAALVSAAAFAFIHGRLSDMTAPFFLGLLYAFVTMQSGSVRISIFLHAANNLFTLAVIVLSALGLSSAANITQIVMLVLGAVSLIYIRGDLKFSLTDDEPPPSMKHAWLFFVAAALYIAGGMLTM